MKTCHFNDTNSKYTNSNHHNIILHNALYKSNAGDLYSAYFNGYNSIKIIKMKYIVH